ncbi:hypothetical protein EYF80_058932 [Liparis tanakae]|uniref:Uncharacterized protein n=1 Tax=Liparis tanakae TaxID=230148 RepID=A0A4Z2EPT0_9TELE|nr:hypothetical protein EYF80_058932 [Liparis tanakae]
MLRLQRCACHSEGTRLIVPAHLLFSQGPHQHHFQLSRRLFQTEKKKDLIDPLQAAAAERSTDTRAVGLAANWLRHDASSW